ncbi:hypothetical protein Tco_0274945, partial [Tanacetum coccineum]
MSSASSAITYTSVYTDSKPGRVFWGADDEISDGGPEEPQTPPVPQDEDEHELMFIQPHDPDYVPEPIYPDEGTKPVIPPPSTDITTTGARITVRLQASISLPPEAEVERLLSMPTPPPSPPISLSPPS